MLSEEDEDDFEHVAELNFDADADSDTVCWECFTPLDNACQRAYYDE
jgi:hypothetical protein